MQETAMSAPGLWPEMMPAEPKPVTEKTTEAVMLALLVQRYTRVSMGAQRYAFAKHVPTRPGFGDRIADFIAIDCYGAFKGHVIHGHEVKVSRSDWLTELKTPEKSGAFIPYMDYWWLVAANNSICRREELPAGWGLMVKVGDGLRAVVRAPRLTPAPLPRPLMASLLRATAKTAASLGAAL